MPLEIEVTDTGVERRLLAIQARIRDRNIIARALAYQENQHLQRFRDEVDPDGNPWAPLAESTLATKRNPKILVEDIGRIPRSSFIDVERGVTGFTDPLAAIHNNGAEIPAVTIIPRRADALFLRSERRFAQRVNKPPQTLPARPFVGLTQEDIRVIVRILRRGLLGLPL